jgi:4-aminobutyrate aminotransferase
MLGMELVKDRTTRARAIDEAEAVMYDSLRRGLSFKLTMGNILALQPPLTITHQEMDTALNILDTAISEVESGR